MNFNNLGKVDKKPLNKHKLVAEPTMRELEHAMKIMAYFQDITPNNITGRKKR